MPMIGSAPVAASAEPEPEPVPLPAAAPVDVDPAEVAPVELDPTELELDPPAAAWLEDWELDDTAVTAITVNDSDR